MLSSLKLGACVGAALLLWPLLRTFSRRRRGERLLVADAGPISFMIAQFWPPRGWLGNRWSHWIPYANAGRTVIPGLFPLTAKRWYWVSDPQASKAILNDRIGYVKDVQSYEIVQFFGKNIVGTEGDEWVKHRSIARKSFGERNNALMWTETLRVMDEWFSERDAEIVARGGSTSANVTSALREITLLVFASAAFGLSFSQSTLGDVPEGYTMSFGKSLFVAIDNMFVHCFTPRILYALPFKIFKETQHAYHDLPRYIRQLIKEARARGIDAVGDDEDDIASDLFRRLIGANDSEKDSSTRLDDDELVSNIYAFFLAGHETSAHTLTFCFALLALYPEIQNRIFEEVKQVWATNDSIGSSSTIADFNKLEYTMAVVREALRLFPAEMLVYRVATKDTSLPSMMRQSDGSWVPESVEVPNGTACVVNIHSIHMSPLYWGEDVEEFRPERFLEPDWPRDAWIPFTVGPRVCIGQRFALIESVCIIARTIFKYRLSPPSDILALPKAMQYEKLLKYTIGVTTTPGDVNITLTPRHQ